MKCVILQPSYIPWRGYFHQIEKADIFVFLDDVQFDRRGWRNRNRIKTAKGTRWLTVPVFSRNHQLEQTPINEIPICWDRAWNSTHWNSLRHAYGKAPFFDDYAPTLEKIYRSRPSLLADFTIELTILLSEQLGLGGKRFIRSSMLGVGGAKTDKVIAVLEKLGASHYISGPSAKEYIEAEKFEAAGIELEYMDYRYPEYEQLHPPYDPQVSILDLLFMKGPRAAELIWANPFAAQTRDSRPGAGAIPAQNRALAQAAGAHRKRG